MRNLHLSASFLALLYSELNYLSISVKLVLVHNSVFLYDENVFFDNLCQGNHYGDIKTMQKL